MRPFTSQHRHGVGSTHDTCFLWISALSPAGPTKSRIYLRSSNPEKNPASMQRSPNWNISTVLITGAGPPFTIYQPHRSNASTKFKKNKSFSWRSPIFSSTFKSMINCKLIPDPLSLQLAQEFDLIWDGTTAFQPHELPNVPETYGIGLIVGPSGSGKSILLGQFGTPEHITWTDNFTIAAHFPSAQEAHKKFAAVGLNSVPTWFKPYRVLSTGEKFRADLARRLKSGAIIDEFTSVVDRSVAMTTSIALRRHVDRAHLTNIIIASCHTDIIRWLEPDWIFNTSSGILDARGRVQRPRIRLDVYRCTWRAWPLFRPHHYLSDRLHHQSQCFVGFWHNRPIVFTAVLAFPHPSFKRAFREHRTVVLPQYQGAGIGPKFSDSIAQLYSDRGCRFYSRTSHPRMGEYRNHSPLWRPTRSNQRLQTTKNLDTSIQDHWRPDARRTCYSHQYIGH